MKRSKAKKWIPLFDLTVSPKTKREVSLTLASGWLTSGPKVAALEKAVSEYLNVKYAVAVSSGTAGLYLALRAIGAEKEKEVITTPFTFVATIEAIMMTGATPVFADIDQSTLNIDPEQSIRKISGRTAAIVPVDIAGYPADYEQLSKICKERSLFLLADAAHSFGATFKSKAIPQLSDAAAYSFYSTKNLTSGEGGMVLSSRKTLIDKVRRLSKHGLTSSTYERVQEKRWGYDVADFGFKANMSDVHASIGLGQLTTFEKDQFKRATLAQRYMKNLSDLSDFLDLPAVEKNYRHGWHLFITKLNLSHLKISRDQFIKLMANYNIECGVHYKPVFELTYYRKALGLSSESFPNASKAYRRVVTLPLYPSLKMREVDYICDCIREITRNHAR
ncbi:MAG: DegT/DnrJ/EryC1/StrS family aminotransferase [Candidatus Zixiibacteriota bacterium]